MSLSIIQKQKPTISHLWSSVPHEQLFVHILVAFGGLDRIKQFLWLDEVLMVISIHVVWLGDIAGHV